jgi:NAD(P)-dependent dehydrogenase (short-subunit alcohol dehydrogenase family)
MLEAFIASGEAMGRLENKVVLITGAGSGIGRASAIRVAGEGAAVFCVDLAEEALESLLAELADSGARAAAHRCDISDQRAVAACVQACVDEFGRLDALVNMAGILRFDDTQQLGLSQWQQVLDINLTGTLLLCQAALPQLVENRGSIVNAASTAALAGLPCGVAYSASKGGVLAMTRSIAVEYAKRGVRANCICPGDIQTNMTSAIDFPESMDFSLMPRLSSLSGARGPETVAGVIAMLISDDGIHITGEDIRVDGGTLS